MDHHGFDLHDVNAPETDQAPPWGDPAWLAAADAWIGEACEAVGLARRGPAAARCRMWSVVARVPVEGDVVWFKANPPGSAFEPALGDALTRWRPQDAPPMIAVDVERAWGLTGNVGERLDGLLKTDPDIRHLHTPLRRYAALQRGLAARLEDLLALGVPDARPGAVPALLEQVISRVPGGLVDADAVANARKKLPLLTEWAAELDGLGIAPTIDHEDLHPGNVLGVGGDSRPFDWGDSCVAHPFGSLLSPLRTLPDFVGVPHGDPRAGELRDVYLEPWLAEGRWSAAELRRAVSLALRLTPVLRSHTWTRMFPCFLDSPRIWDYAQGWLSKVGVLDPVSETF